MCECDLGRRAARRGEGLPLIEYICQQMNEQTGVRDFNRDGEAFAKSRASGWTLERLEEL